MYWTTELMFWNEASTWPPMMSAWAGPPPLYGMWMPVVPVCCQNSSAVRWSLVPLPAEAKVILPGLVLRLAITSASDLCGEAVGTTRTFGERTATVIGSKSFSGSYCMPFIRCGMITSGPSEVTRKVWPSGAARLTSLAPMVPGGAGPVVDDEGLLELVRSLGPMARATWSVDPPGGNGTTSVTGFCGPVPGHWRWRRQ